MEFFERCKLWAYAEECLRVLSSAENLKHWGWQTVKDMVEVIAYWINAFEYTSSNDVIIPYAIVVYAIEIE